MAPKPEQPTRPFHAHYISGTHWDREWYRPLQEFRMLLVEVLDSLLDIMEKTEDFRYFHLDGQTCVMQDYLEIRPDQRPRLEKLIREGRILIGPWFTMPDLFCPGDEALIRNFLMGQRISQEWGVKPMPVAYTCDMFGHPSQMPQIYSGFDLTRCVLGRGTNEHTTDSFFRWEAPDGSSVFCFKLQDPGGYGAFVRARTHLEAPGADKDPEAESRAKESLQSYIAHETGRSNGPVLCLMDALDHQMPAMDAPRYIRLVEGACPDVSVTHSRLPDFFAEAERKAEDVKTKRGELREPAKGRHGYLWLIANCVSSRIRMKQANDWCQALMERWVEPLVAIANREGAKLPQEALRVAWENILLNHAHDSICGCSIDQVHRDMMYRYDQARLLSEHMRHKAFGALTQGCADLAKEEHEFTVTVANPVSLPSKRVVTFDVDFPVEYPTRFQEGFRSQPLNSFILEDLDGNEVPYQRLAMEPSVSERDRHGKPGGISSGDLDRYTVAAELDLPAMGFTSLLVKPCPTPIRRMGSLRTGPNTAENGYLKLAIAPNGTASLTDKATGETYADLLTFEDRSEIGDGWFHGETVADEIALSTGAGAQISVVHDGPEIVTFRVAVIMDLPSRYDWHRERRSEERGELVITSLISLRRGARTVEVETVVDNTIEDHRLRLLLPTDARKAKTWLAHHPFDLVERSIALDPETVTWSEMDLPEKPFLGLQSVGAGKRGLAYLSAGGVHEGGVRDDARRTMQVTMMRSYRRTVGTPGERDGLEIGKVTYRYALMPFEGELPRSEALAELARLQAGILTRQTGPRPSGYPPMAGSAEPRACFLQQETGALVLSTCKPAEKGRALVVRLWNPGDEPATDTLTFWRELRKASLVKLSEKPVRGGQLEVNGPSVTVNASPRSIVTVKVDLK